MTTINLNTVQFDPLIALEWLIALSAIFTALTLFGLISRKQGTALRLLTGSILLLILANPIWTEKQQQSLNNIVALILDMSPSQNFEQRQIRSSQALENLQKQLASIPNLKVRFKKVSAATSSNKTKLFEALEETFNDVPENQRAGAILITDGQVHDAPKEDQKLNYGPIHALLSGSKNAYDRRITLTKSPAYGITGQNVTLSFKVETSRKPSPDPVEITITNDQGETETLWAKENEEYSIDLPIEHAGQNIFELKTETYKDELTDINNKAVSIVNGVRDRLKVLLVSGKPHTGERTWRNLLTSDPAVDLVHFTILREITKRDNTPADELSLIPFPFRELFEVKLYDFDLIIFDNYRLNNILPDRYFENIVKYVREGGALLEASGQSYSDPQKSIYHSPLGQILPAAPTGVQILKSYKASLTDKGKAHPITRGLDSNWAPWLQQSQTRVKDGDILMDGNKNNPLLIVKREENGRIAQFTSDHLWLWAKDYKQGGPYAELSRRIIHWLMKEPDLDEKQLQIEIKDHTIKLRKQNYEENGHKLSLIKPDGQTQNIELKEDEQGWLSAEITTDQDGLHEFEDQNHVSTYAIVGENNPLETQNILGTDSLLAPIIKQSQGTTTWIQDKPSPKITMSHTKPSSRYGRSGHLQLRDNKAANTIALKQHQIFKPWLSLILSLILLVITWWYEARRNL